MPTYCFHYIFCPVACLFFMLALPLLLPSSHYVHLRFALPAVACHYCHLHPQFGFTFSLRLSRYLHYARYLISYMKPLLICFCLCLLRRIYICHHADSFHALHERAARRQDARYLREPRHYLMREAACRRARHAALLSLRMRRRYAAAQRRAAHTLLLYIDRPDGHSMPTGSACHVG